MPKIESLCKGCRLEEYIASRDVLGCASPVRPDNMVRIDWSEKRDDGLIGTAKTVVCPQCVPKIERV